ncbi:hypothetical protein KX928_08435 [Roseobacter sp. YSTF-M11]|uniref:Uncharacterized protein n=1 Tax=Roseobacter insulae TaxID=2859783 RepID=A0A9X1FU86_9RHOB|nr:hypothetical protein [Roseobacter insulae]MBW4707811.1 hypothetical protein [Roseobacter insulae]
MNQDDRPASGHSTVREPERTGKWLMFLIGTLPLVFYATTELLTYRLNNPVINGLTPTFETESTYYDNATRFTLQAALIFYFWLVVGAVCLFLKEVLAGVGLQLFSMRKIQGPRAEKRFGAWEEILFFLFLISVTIGIALMFGSVAGENRNYKNLGSELFISILNHCHEVHAQDADCTFGAYSAGNPPSGFNLYLDLITYLAAIGLAACSLGTARAVCISRVELMTWTRAQVFRLPNLFLYVSSVLFTGAMLCVYTWSGWPAQFLEGDQQTAFRTLQNSIALFWGTSFTLVILSFYLPTVLYLNAKISGLEHAKSGELTEDSMPRQIVKILEKALAVLAPIITALISAAAAKLLEGNGA